MPWATSCIRPAQLVKFMQERSFEKPPGGGVLSSDGGIATREQALRACTCCDFINMSPCKGALKASTYLFAPLSVWSTCGNDSQREPSSEFRQTYSHLQ